MSLIRAMSTNNNDSKESNSKKSRLLDKIPKIGLRRAQTTSNTTRTIPTHSASSKTLKTKQSLPILKRTPEPYKLKYRPNLYPAFLSEIAFELKKSIITQDRIKDDILYHNVFDGKEAVDKLKDILGVSDRVLALRVGRSLELQRFFHDVGYENRLIDDIKELYQFNELLFQDINNRVKSPSIESNPEDDVVSVSTDTSSITQQRNHSFFPIGIYTDLTHCYSPTCNRRYPCYSYTCPKREKLKNRPHSVDTKEKRVTAYTFEIQKKQKCWFQSIDYEILLSTPTTERKRQEIIFELIYTEGDFLKDLDYITTMWIEPLKTSDIIPIDRRDDFIDKVFSNLHDLREISQRFSLALCWRQQEHPIVSEIGDLLDDFSNQLDPFVHYISRQHQAKHIYDRERYNNPRFAAFAELAERHPASQKLELNGYLTKPTSRLGKYPLLLEKIHQYTLPHHPDRLLIPVVIDRIKHVLCRVNQATGLAKNRFELEEIQAHVSFRFRQDSLDLDLLHPERLIVKHSILRKTANLDSSEFHIILFDHYLIMAKKKRVHAVDHYTIQKRPIPIELLGVLIPPSDGLQRSGSFSRQNSLSSGSFCHERVGSPIKFYHQGRPQDDGFTLYASDEINRKAWIDLVMTQKEIKSRKKPIFKTVNIVKRFEFFSDIKTHHMILLDIERKYLLATDLGVYLGPYDGIGDSTKILALDKVQQLAALEDYQLLLVLADGVLWQFPLDKVIGGQQPHENVFFGRKIMSHVPFFHVGACLSKTFIWVPKPRALNGTDIEVFEPIPPKIEKQPKKSIFSRLSPLKSLSLMNTQVKSVKTLYNPYDVWAIDHTKSLVLLTTQMGISAIDMKTTDVYQLLDPQDKSLRFITKTEKIDEFNPVKKLISIFQTPGGDYLVCYDQYAFYIDKKGRRIHHEFMIEWEGIPTSFSYCHPYVIAFEYQFIEVRSALDGHLAQIIQEKDVYCLHNGYKSTHIIGTTVDKTNNLYQHIFKLQLVQS